MSNSADSQNYAPENNMSNKFELPIQPTQIATPQQEKKNVDRANYWYQPHAKPRRSHEIINSNETKDPIFLLKMKETTTKRPIEGLTM